MGEHAILFTTDHFPRCESRVPQARVPLAVAVDPFSEAVECFGSSLPRCAECGAYPTKADAGSYVQTKWKCDFCERKNETIMPFDFHDAVDFETQVDEKHAQTLFLVDSSKESHDSGFFQTVVQSLDASIPSDMTNFIVSCVSSSVSFITEKRSILVLPYFDEDCRLPPSIVIRKKPSSFASFLREEPGSELMLEQTLRLLLSFLMPNSKVIFYISSQPHGFRSSRKGEFFRSSNITPACQEVLQCLHKKNISISFICYRNCDIDVVALSQISDILNGELILLEKNQLNDVEAYSKLIGSSLTMRASIRTLDSIKLGSSYGYRPRNPSDFLMTSTESPIFPAEVISLGKKAHPVQLSITYFDHNGKKRIRVFTRFIDMTDALIHVFETANSDILAKCLAAQFVENSLLGNQINDQLARDFIWPIFYDYQMNALFYEKPDETKLVYPKSLSDLARKALALLHCSAFSPTTEPSKRLYQLRRLSTIRRPLLKKILNARPCEVGTQEPLIPEFSQLQQCKAYILYDGFTTYLWGAKDIDPHLIKGALQIVDSSNEAAFKERFMFDSTSYTTSKDTFLADLLEDVKTRGHMWVLKMDPEDIKKLLEE